MPDPIRILIVDDEVSQMKALCNTLRDQGYLTTGFTSGHEALAALPTEKFDLLLTDLMMPGMDGISLLRAALKADGDLVGIVMTGHGTVDTAVEAMKVGALDYILKPFKLSIILPVLSRALAVRRLRLENAALTTRLSQRTVELEAANGELEAFSYSIAHDLRAPLHSVNGFAAILLEEFAPQLPPEAKRLLRVVTGSAQHMGRLIDDLLRFARLSRQPMVPNPVNIAVLVREVLEELRSLYPAHGVQIVTADLPDAVGDLSLIRQVFVNLLSNAYKFTRHTEEARVEVGCQRGGGETVYFVRDNGAGFDMEFAQKLFGVFQRMHRADEFEGTGIGLSIVRRVVQRHGGRIWAESQVNHGASFFFTLAPGGDPSPLQNGK
jgi:signal transduction histidine kinase